MKQGKPCYKHGAVPTLPAPACSNNTPIRSCTSFLHDREIHFVCCQPFGLGGRAYRCSCPLLHPYLNTQSQLIIQLIMYGGAAASPAGALSLLLSTTDFHLPLHLLRRHHHGSAQPSGIKVLRCRRRSRVMAGCCGPTEVGRSFGFRAKLQQHARSNRAKQTNGCTSNQQMNLASSLGNHETRSEPTYNASSYLAGAGSLARQHLCLLSNTGSGLVICGSLASLGQPWTAGAAGASSQPPPSSCHGHGQTEVLAASQSLALCCSRLHACK